MLRRLSGMERGMLMAEEDMPISFATTARIRGAFSIDELRMALSKVRRRHPLLAVRVVKDEHGQPWFASEGVPEFPVRVVEGVQDDDWIRVVGEELDKTFSREIGPLVRFVWLKGADVSGDFSNLMTVSHHAISDGLAGAYLMRDILHHLGHPDAGVEPLPLLPASNDLIPPEVVETLSQYSFSDLMAQIPMPELMEGEEAVPFERSAGFSKLCISAWSLDEPQTAALISRAHEEGTTVHGALGTAFLLSFAHVFGDGWVRRIQSPVSLRNYLSGPVGEDFGVFMALAKTTVDCAPGRNFWQIAREMKVGFNRGTTPEKLFAMPVLAKIAMASFSSPEANPEGMHRMSDFFLKVDYDLSLSNIGRLDFPVTYGPLRLESLYGPTFSATPGDRVVGVNTVGGRMHFTFVFRDVTLDASTGEQVKDLAMQRLGEAVGW